MAHSPYPAAPLPANTTPFEKELLEMPNIRSMAANDIELFIDLMLRRIGTDNQRSAVIRILQQLRQPAGSQLLPKILREISTDETAHEKDRASVFIAGGFHHHIEDFAPRT